MATLATDTAKLPSKTLPVDIHKPLTPNSNNSSDARTRDIAAREAAIKRKLSAANTKSAGTAKAKLSKGVADLVKKKKSGTVSASYNTQAIKGADQGFSKSDYGAGAGAAIPYQIGDKKTNVSKSVKATKPKPKPKPKAKSGGHTSYKVKKGDTLSGIAKRHGTTVDKIWNYNLKNRSKKTQATLRKRGKNLIFRGGTFYIPR